jgi:uncharacterized repeat protein (TIGR02543 family)
MLIHPSRPMKIIIAAFVSLIVILSASMTACGTQPNTVMTPAAPTLSSTEAYLVSSPGVTKTTVPTQYTLTTSLMPDGAGTISPYQKVCDPNTNVELKVACNPGYRFDRWSGDFEGTSISPTILMDKSKNITANFVKQYSVSMGLVPADGGTVTPAPESYDAGSKVTFTVKPKAGYVFNSWSGDVTGSSDQITVTVDKNKDINANFKPVPTATETTPATLTMDILEAQNKGLVDVSGQGQSLLVIYVTVTSKSANPLNLTIPAGTVFDGPNDGVSSMVVLSSATISLDAYRISSHNQVWAAAIDMKKGMASSTTTNLTLSKTPVSGDLKLFIDFAAGPTVRIEIKLALYAIWTIQNNPARNEYLQTGSGSSYGVPTDPEWSQIKDVFQKAGIDTSKYKTFR